MSDIYEQERVRLNDFVDALPWQEGQCGAVFVIDGAVSGLEVFDSAATVEKVFPKLVRSYALDAMDRRQERSTAPESGNAESFLDVVKNAECQAYDAIGLGEDIRISDPSLMGGALFVDGRCVHLSAFPRRQESGHEDLHGSRTSRASARGRGR